MHIKCEQTHTADCRWGSCFIFGFPDWSRLGLKTVKILISRSSFKHTHTSQLPTTVHWKDVSMWCDITCWRLSQMTLELWHTHAQSSSWKLLHVIIKANFLRYLWKPFCSLDIDFAWDAWLWASLYVYQIPTITENSKVKVSVSIDGKCTPTVWNPENVHIYVWVCLCVRMWQLLVNKTN